MVKPATAYKSELLRTSSVKRNVIVNALIFIGVLYLFGWQLRGLSGSLLALRHVDLGLGLLALLATMVTFVAAAMSYQVLSPRPLQFRVTLYVQIASGFVNRLLPAGLGSLGLFASYYRKHGSSLATSSALVATNNILGTLGSALLLAGVLVLHPEYVGRLRVDDASVAVVLITVVGVVIVSIIFARRSRGLTRVIAFMRATFLALMLSLRPDGRNAMALLCNVMVTSLNVLVLSLAVGSAGGVLDWSSALVVLSLGTLVGAAVPTPGGIGGVEAGLLAGMLAFGVPSSIGLAAALLYRVLTYWLPILPGVIMFRVVEQRYL